MRFLSSKLREYVITINTVCRMDGEEEINFNSFSELKQIDRVNFIPHV